VTWVGFDDNRSLEMTGSHAALPIWISFMRHVAVVRPDLVAGSFEQPEGIVEHAIDPTTGLRATDQCPEKKIELFIQGREVEELCTHHPGHPVEELSPPDVRLPDASTAAEPGGEQPPAISQNVAPQKSEPKTRPKFVRKRSWRDWIPF